MTRPVVTEAWTPEQREQERLRSRMAESVTLDIADFLQLLDIADDRDRLRSALGAALSHHPDGCICPHCVGIRAALTSAP